MATQRELEANENSLAQAEADGTPVTVDGITTTGKSNCAEKCREHKVKEKVAKDKYDILTKEYDEKSGKLKELKGEIDDKEKKRLDDLDILVKETVPNAKKEAKRKQRRLADYSSGSTP